MGDQDHEKVDCSVCNASGITWQRRKPRLCSFCEGARQLTPDELASRLNRLAGEVSSLPGAVHDELDRFQKAVGEQAVDAEDKPHDEPGGARVCRVVDDDHEAELLAVLADGGIPDSRVAIDGGDGHSLDVDDTDGRRCGRSPPFGSITSFAVLGGQSCGGEQDKKYRRDDLAFLGGKHGLPPCLRWPGVSMILILIPP